MGGPATTKGSGRSFERRQALVHCWLVTFRIWRPSFDPCEPSPQTSLPRGPRQPNFPSLGHCKTGHHLGGTERGATNPGGPYAQRNWIKICSLAEELRSGILRVTERVLLD